MYKDRVGPKAIGWARAYRRRVHTEECGASGLVISVLGPPGATPICKKLRDTEAQISFLTLAIGCTPIAHRRMVSVPTPVRPGRKARR